MKKNYWYFLAIFAVFISTLTLMPRHLTVAQAEEDKIDKTVNEEENGFGQSDTFDRDSQNAGDEEQTAPEEDFGGSGDDDDDNY